MRIQQIFKIFKKIVNKILEIFKKGELIRLCVLLVFINLCSS